MKVIEKYPPSNRLSVKDAAEVKLNTTDYYSRGSVETEEKVRNIIDMISTLVDKLAENGSLKPNQVEEILGYGYEVVE